VTSTEGAGATVADTWVVGVLEAPDGAGARDASTGAVVGVGAGREGSSTDVAVVGVDEASDTRGAGSDGALGGGGSAGAVSEADAPSSVARAGRHKHSAPKSAAANGRPILAFLGDVIRNPQSE